MKKTFIALLTLLMLAGCAAPVEKSKEEPVTNFEALPAHELINTLDSLPLEERPADFKASIRPEEVITYWGDEEKAVPLEGDFYLSVAPYVNQTHDCFYHSPTTCTGELSREKVEVSVVQEDGTVLFEGTKTAFDNGFIGFWLPRDIKGTMTFSYQGKSASYEFSTGLDDPTCVTDLQLI